MRKSKESAKSFFATCPRGLEALLAQELEQLGASACKQTRLGVHFRGKLALAYRVCLWSRLASRVLLPLAQVPAHDANSLYDGMAAIDWLEHMKPSASLLIDFTGRNDAIRHTQFGAQKAKDAIVDHIRERTGRRPHISKIQPDIRIHVHLERNQAQISFDLSGDSLHRRGYRQGGGIAPLKENLAAAILLRCQWPESAKERPLLFDPMCGSGTLLIEGALMIADIAPGLLREHFGFIGWRKHQDELWQELIAEAKQRAEQGKARLEQVYFAGSDADAKILAQAEKNAMAAGLTGVIDLTCRKVENMNLAVYPETAGNLITNPPYGERMGEVRELIALHEQLGQHLKQQAPGWQVAVFSSEQALQDALALKADKHYAMFNGSLPCRLSRYSIRAKPGDSTFPNAFTAAVGGEPESPVDNMFANRLRKNLKHYKKWVAREGIQAYRLYDADMPEYAVAVDVYGDWACVQEYAPPAKVDKLQAHKRLNTALTAVPQVLDIAPERCVLKQRKRQSGRAQYNKQDHTDHYFTITEHDCQLYINLHDYLDTGLFLDHRPVRRMIQQKAAGKRFLNLFCYTASASVHAAKGGASSTLSIDMSATYLDWAHNNMALNGFTGSKHQLQQEDCLRWLEKARGEFDLILLDPPTFSNSKRMEGVLDIQRDHARLIHQCMRLLAEGGTLLFSNNYRGFKLDSGLHDIFAITDISAQSLDMDFQRNRKIHQCFEIKAAQ